jgi:dTDP-4-amino-4,6-dideoxygalactose transaminase
VFVDIEPATFNIDVAEVEAAITNQTRAVVPVHLFGQMAPMKELLTLAEKHNLAVIEDAAQAIGAKQDLDSQWHMAGALGLTGAFSFFPSKNLGAWGDGGLIVTQDDELAERLRKLRTHGGAKQYHHEEVGTNSRLDTVQAAVLLAKLPYLEKWNAARRAHARVYSDAFEELQGVSSPYTDYRNEHVYNQYTLRVPRRDELRSYLNERGIGSAVYYPKPLHLQACFDQLGYSNGQLPVSEKACSEVLSLPVYPEMNQDQQECVIDAVTEFYR